MLLLGIGLAAGSAAGAASARQEWKPTKGDSFVAEPVEAIGPMAIFRTGSSSSRLLALRLLSPEDCVRFHQAIAHRPPLAPRWSDAKGDATAECIGRLQKWDKGQLRAHAFDAVPEPELMIVLFIGRPDPQADYGRSGRFLFLENLMPFISRVQRVYPNRVATIVWGERQTAQSIAGRGNGRQWLAVDPRHQFGLSRLSRFAPGMGVMLVLMTRQGTPLFGGPVNDITEVKRFVDGASDMLWQLNPANPRGARDRLHYLTAVRPVEHAAGKAEPLLLIDPLRVEALRQRGVTRVEAALEVGVNGRATDVRLLPSSDVPAPLAPAVTDALRRNAFFLPAIDSGGAVAGNYHYALTVGRADPKRAADAAWVNGEARNDVPFKSWLVLKPIKVPEQVFSSVQSVGADGTVMLSAVTAGDSKKIPVKAQVNAFNSDWFDQAGAASVQPVAGQKQQVFGDDFVWRSVKPDEGMVDFLGSSTSGSLDYCVGYAWTEVEVPEDTDAWLGFGSDDGVKIWVNGELVNDQWIERSGKLDDEVIPLRLKKGKNTFLVKIQNVRWLWNFTARLRTRAA